MGAKGITPSNPAEVRRIADALREINSRDTDEATKFQARQDLLPSSSQGIVDANESYKGFYQTVDKICSGKIKDPVSEMVARTERCTAGEQSPEPENPNSYSCGASDALRDYLTKQPSGEQRTLWCEDPAFIRVKR